LVRWFFSKGILHNCSPKIVLSQHVLPKVGNTGSDFGYFHYTTGSIAKMLGESGGCESEFAMKYVRRTVGMTEGEDTYYEDYCKAAREYMAVNGVDTLPSWFISAPEIPWQDRIRTQAVMQKQRSSIDLQQSDGVISNYVSNP